MIEKSLVIKNESGIHMRPASKLVEVAGKCNSEVRLLHNGKTINAKSVLNVMAAAIKCQDTVTVQCEGETEAADLETIVAAIESGLGE